MARARALLLLLASLRSHGGDGSAALRSHGGHGSAARFATASCVGHTLPPGAAAGARRALTLPPRSHALRPGSSSGAGAGASSGARTPLGVAPPEADSYAQACVGLSPVSGRKRFALLAAYATAAVYTYLDSPDGASDDDTNEYFVLPRWSYPPDPPFGDATFVQLGRKGPPLPTRKDIQDVKELLFLILQELRRPKPNNWLSPFIIEFMRDPTAFIFFPYLTVMFLSGYLRETFGDLLTRYECPFSGMIELPLSSSFDPVTENNRKGGCSDGGEITLPYMEWGKNVWPAPNKDTEGSQSSCDACYNIKMSPEVRVVYFSASGAWEPQILGPKRSINEAATDWGLKCLCYEIRDISPPKGVRVAMEMQEEAERRKRAQILESEGEAEAVFARSQATAKGIRMDSESMSAEGRTEAANLRVAEQYIKAFAALAKNTTTMLLPSDAGNPSAMIAQCMQIYKHTFKSSSPKGGSHLAEEAEEAHLTIL